jgi:thioesterase domain-containing protein
MTRDIFGAIKTADHSNIVPLRTSGAGLPLFCFPGSGGNIYVFQEMVAALPEGQPVFALDMEWLCDADLDFTVEQLAAYYVNAIRKIQNKGPYYFCGYSFGGLVAYETATRLTNEGNSISLIALLDAPNPALMSNLSKADSVQFRMTYFVDRIRRYGLQLARGDIKGFIGRGVAFFISRVGGFLMPSIKFGFRIMNKRLPEKLRVNDPSFLRAWRSYNPKSYPKNLVCFRVTDRGPEHDRNASMGWDICAVGGVQVHVVPGGHVDMMRMPSVATVADQLARYLDSGSARVCRKTEFPGT